MTKSISTSELQDRLVNFTSRSIEWCAKESEASTTRVTDAIDLLLQNTARVSELSAASLDAIVGLQKTLKFKQVKGLDLGQVISSLQSLAKEHEEIQGVIQPIIRSLQFQDRLRQNLENVQKMIPLWVAKRRHFENSPNMDQDSLMDFGKELMQHTTMKSERDIIRKFIAGLEPEADIANVNFF